MVPVLITNDIIAGLAYSSWLSSLLTGGTGNATVFSNSTSSSFMPAAPKTQSPLWTIKMLRSTAPTSGSLPLFLYKCNILAITDFVCSVAQNTTLMLGTVLKMKSMSLLTGKGVWTVVSKPIPPWGKHTCRTVIPCHHHPLSLRWTHKVAHGVTEWEAGHLPLSQVCARWCDLQQVSWIPFKFCPYSPKELITPA